MKSHDGVEVPSSQQVLPGESGHHVFLVVTPSSSSATNFEGVALVLPLHGVVVEVAAVRGSKEEVVRGLKARRPATRRRLVSGSKICQNIPKIPKLAEFPLILSLI